MNLQSWLVQRTDLMGGKKRTRKATTMNMTENRKEQISDAIGRSRKMEENFRKCGFITRARIMRERIARLEKELELLNKPDLKEWSDFVTS